MFEIFNNHLFVFNNVKKFKMFSKEFWVYLYFMIIAVVKDRNIILDLECSCGSI